MKEKVSKGKSNRPLDNLQTGFTFIEVILYVSIVSIFLVALIPIAWNLVSGSAKSAVEQEVFSQARFISERLKYEIRNANSINSVAAGSIDLNTAVNAVTVIDLSSGKLRIKYGAGGTPVNLNSTDTTISGLTFTDYTSVDNKTKNIGFSFIIDDNSVSSRQEYNAPSVTVQGSAEVRSN